MHRLTYRTDDRPAPTWVAAWAGIAILLVGAPAAADFEFEVHEMGEWGNGLGQTCLADVDRDGDLDFFSGARTGPDGDTVSWWEYRGPSEWVRHEVGTGHDSDVGGTCYDVDGDGWVDQISGRAWYRNNQDGTFERHAFGGISSSHDMRVIDLGDATGVASLADTQTSLKLYTIPSDPTEDWPVTDVGDWSDAQDTDEQAPHSGLTVCDVNGDDDEDLVVYNRWYENRGSGSNWKRHDIPYTHHVDQYFGTTNDCADLDGDGDADIALSDHDGSWGVWAENTDGDGSEWTIHQLTTDRNKMHSLQIADFDNDGDNDIYMGDTGNPGAPGTFAIFENDGSGEFTERLFELDVPGHETRAGDVDGDGDIDLVSKPWDFNQTENAGRHVYIRNLCIENGTCDEPSGPSDARTDTDTGDGGDAGDPEPDTHGDEGSDAHSEGDDTDGSNSSDATALRDGDTTGGASAGTATGASSKGASDENSGDGGCRLVRSRGPLHSVGWLVLLLVGIAVQRRPRTSNGDAVPTDRHEDV